MSSHRSVEFDLGSAGFDPAITRRLAHDPALRERIHRAVRAATSEVQARRIREWCASDTGDFPVREESATAATREVATLCRVLGGLCAITAREVDEAAELFRAPHDPEDFR